MTLLTLGGQVLDAVKKRLPAEAYLARSENRTQEWSEGRPENLAVTKSQGIGLRVIDSGKLGFSSTNKSDPDAVAWLVDSAVAAAGVTAADSFLELPKPERGTSEKKLEIVDLSLEEGFFEQRSSFLATLEAKVKERDKRLSKVLRASYREGRYESAV